MAKDDSTILVIDDDPSIVRTLTKVLTRAGFKVDAARSGSEAIQKLRENSYDVSIVDLRLGDMEGTELLSMMQKASPQMLRIMLTGTPIPNSRLEEAQGKADFFLLKPVKPQELLAIIDSRLKINL